MGKYEGILLVTDFDGTFAERAHVSDANAQAVRYFQSEGGRFTIASGRTPDFLIAKRDFFQVNAPLISNNGTLINDYRGDMTMLREFPLDDVALDALADMAENTRARMIYIYNPESEDIVWERKSGVDIRLAFRDVPRPWYKGLLVQEPNETPDVLRAVRKCWGARYAFERSWPMGIEIHQRGTGKGECLESVREMLPEPIRLTVGVGDYDNDVSLLRMSDIGYAVANADESVRAVADRVTVRNTEDAIARIIEELAL